MGIQIPLLVINRRTSRSCLHGSRTRRASLFVIEPSDEGEEQGGEKQKSTPGAAMKHWNFDGTSNDIVLHLNLLLWLERAIVLPLI